MVQMIRATRKALPALRACCRTAAFAAAGLALPAACLGQGMGSMHGQGNATATAGMNMMVPPAQVFEKLLSNEEHEIVGAAEAMPADKFNFAPSSSMGTYTGVRTFAAQIKHLTAANYAFFRDFNISGGKSRGDIDKLTNRDQILQALKDSYSYAHQAIATITPQNAFVNLDGKGITRVGMAAYCLAHSNDHYGQMVEYLRMNGIVPPASRR